MTLRKRWTLPLAVLAAVLVLGGCRLDGDVAVTLDGDGAGRMAVTLTADEQLLARTDRAGADPLGTLVRSASGLAGWRVSRRDDAGARSVTLFTTFADPHALTEVSTQFADALAAPDLRPLGPLYVEVADDTISLRGTAGLVVTDAVAAAGIAPDAAREALAGAVGYTVTVDLPGEVLETDADERIGQRRVRWTVAAGEHRALRVTARRPWTLARVVDLLITPTGMFATAVGIAALIAWRRAARNRPLLSVPRGQALAPSRSARRRARSERT